MDYGLGLHTGIAQIGNNNYRNQMDPITMGIAGGTEIIGSLANLWQGKKERIHQRQMSQQGWERDVEMWNMQNEYNSPVNQMKRLQEAGINPNMALGGGQMTGNASSMPKYQVPQQHFPSVEMPNVLGMIQQYQDIKVKNAQADLITSNTREQEIINNYLDGKLNADVFQKWLNVGKDQYLLGLDRDKDIENTGKGLRFQITPDSYFGQQMKSQTLSYQNDALSKAWDQLSKGLNFDMERSGINKSDSAYLRMMALKEAGYNKAEMLPHIVGEWLANLTGKVVGNIIPYGKFKGSLNTQRFQGGYNTKNYIHPNAKNVQYVKPYK